MTELMPAIVQDADTLQVLMLGYMNAEALGATRLTGRVTFYSRSKQRLWTKGEVSGNFLELVDIAEDCDRDALLIRARPKGPTCHRETTSCFGDASAPGVGFLAKLELIIDERARNLPEGSYTAGLFRAPLARTAQKVGEEAVETVVAALGTDGDAITNEAADLVFHLLVLLHRKDLGLEHVVEALRGRHTPRIPPPRLRDAP